MKITNAACGYIAEPLLAPFGFKGGYLSELWQVAARLECGDTFGVGPGIQSVLWSDAAVFAANSQDAGNQMMYDMTRYALECAKGMDFSDPFRLLNELFPKVWAYGKKITGRDDLRATFALNALVPVDFAAWQLYGKLQNTENILDLLSPEMAATLAGKQNNISRLCHLNGIGNCLLPIQNYFIRFFFVYTL